LFATYMPCLRGFREVQLATNADYLTPQNKRAILDNCTFISVSLHDYLMPNQTELSSFFYDALGVGVETQISILDSLLENKRVFTRAWLSHVDRVRIYKTHSANGFGNMEGVDVPVESCGKPFAEITVYWDGKVGLCNHDWNNGASLGDLNTQSISDVWTGKPYQDVRQLHREGTRFAVDACKDCSFEKGQVYGEVIRSGG